MVFLLAGGFLLLYISLYHSRKKRDLQEKEQMSRHFEQELTKSKMEVQEQTLKTIGSDIHDNIGQILSVAKLNLGSIKPSDAPEKIHTKAETAYSLLELAIRESRHLAQILQPSGILVRGLEKAIVSELEWISKSDKIAVHFNNTGENNGKLGGDRELIVFRIVQEALNNAIKHADASEITVTLQFNRQSVDIVVKDNGKGFNVAEKKGTDHGLGLHSFEERAKLISGSLTIESGSACGTTLFLSVPYHS